MVGLRWCGSSFIERQSLWLTAFARGQALLIGGDTMRVSHRSCSTLLTNEPVFPQLPMAWPVLVA